jgi:hypothetical protein
MTPENALTKLQEAAEAVQQLLQETDCELPISLVAELAAERQLSPAALLQLAEDSATCWVDYATGNIRCAGAPEETEEPAETDGSEAFLDSLQNLMGSAPEEATQDEFLAQAMPAWEGDSAGSPPIDGGGEEAAGADLSAAATRPKSPYLAPYNRDPLPGQRLWI